MVGNFLIDDNNQQCLLAKRDGTYPHLQPPNVGGGAAEVMLQTTVASTSGNLYCDDQEARRGVSGQTLKP